MKKFDLSQLPSAVVGVPLQGGGAHPIGSKPGGVDPIAHGHNEQIDVNMSLANITRFTIAMFGLTAAFAAMTTEAGVRQQLQCALAAAACAVATWFYTRFYTIRRAKGIAYSRAGTAAVDSLRYSCWTVTNGVLAWLAMLLHGPFPADGEPDVLRAVATRQWLRVGPSALVRLAVLCAGSAQFCAESARYQRELGARGSSRGALLGARRSCSSPPSAASTATNLTLQLAGRRRPRARATEIQRGRRSLGRLWFVYPAVEPDQDRADLLHAAQLGGAAPTCGSRRAVLPADARWAEGVRDALLWALRVVSSSHAYAPLPDRRRGRRRRRSLGYALVPPVYTQLFDAAARDRRPRLDRPARARVHRHGAARRQLTGACGGPKCWSRLASSTPSRRTFVTRTAPHHPPPTTHQPTMAGSTTQNEIKKKKKGPNPRKPVFGTHTHDVMKQIAPEASIAVRGHARRSTRFLVRPGGPPDRPRAFKMAKYDRQVDAQGQARQGGRSSTCSAATCAKLRARRGREGARQVREQRLRAVKRGRRRSRHRLRTDASTVTLDCAVSNARVCSSF